jgi:tetratricopeptide (TPR) repeat protein
MAIIHRDYGEYTEAGSIFVELLSAYKESLAFGDPFIMKVAKESKDLWSKIAHDDTLRQRVSAAVGDKKTAVWSPPRETVHGEDHLDTLNRSQLALAMAETHPHGLASQYALAVAYQDNGQVPKAIALLEQIVEIQATTLAETHPHRLASQYALAGVYQDNRQVPKAIVLLEQVVEIQATILAETHPHRLASQHALARAYQDNRQVPKAIALLEQVVEIQATILAPDHPDRLASQYALSHLL